MAVVSKTCAGLIENGEFAAWPEGAWAPRGFSAPSEKSHRQFTYVKPREIKPGEWAVEQKWKASEHRVPLDMLFGAEADLEAELEYEFTASATTIGPVHASIHLYAFPLLSDPQLVRKELVRVEPNTRRGNYVARFTVPQAGRYKLVSRSNRHTPFPSSVFWHAWRLRPLDLAANGDFQIWDDAGLLPVGFQGPVHKRQREFVQVARREVKSGDFAPQVKFVRSEHRLPLRCLFGPVAALEAGRVYRTRLVASAFEDAAVAVRLYAYRRDLDPEVVHRQLGRIEPGSLNRCIEKAFRVPEDGRYKLALRSARDSAYPSRVVIREWRLRLDQDFEVSG